jgi:uncharacterized protein (UPF0264 family)
LRLLVSVRHPAEVAPALRGGADIIDAKEPERGALGAVDPERLRQIDAQVPDSVSLSVALGDFASPDEVFSVIAGLPLKPRQAPVYLKLAPSRARLDLPTILASAVRAAARHPAAPWIIAVEYADRSTGPRSSEELRAAAALTGTYGLLVDTSIKNGRTLLDWWPEFRLVGWLNDARAAGLLVAVAGGLGVREVERAAVLGSDVIGVRGAACVGGRSGSVDAGRVGVLRRVIDGGPGVAPRTATLPAGVPGRSSILK